MKKKTSYDSRTEFSAIERSENSTLYTREQARHSFGCALRGTTSSGASAGLPRASALPLESGKGQITAEFVITLIILFSLFSVVVFVSVQQQENIKFNSEKIKAKTLMEKTARGINGIYLSGEGSETEITKENDFELDFEENVLMVKFSQGQFVSTSLNTKNILHSSESLNPAVIKIRNLNGVIEVVEQ